MHRALLKRHRFVRLFGLKRDHEDTMHRAPTTTCIPIDILRPTRTPHCHARYGAGHAPAPHAADL